MLKFPINQDNRCGRSSMVEQELPKLKTGVQFSSPAPKNAHPQGLSGE